MKLFLGLILLTFSLLATEIYDPETNNSKYRLLVNTNSGTQADAEVLINSYEFNHAETKDTEISITEINGEWFLEIYGIMSVAQLEEIIRIHDYKIYMPKDS